MTSAALFVATVAGFAAALIPVSVGLVHDHRQRQRVVIDPLELHSNRPEQRELERAA